MIRYLLFILTILAFKGQCQLTCNITVPNDTAVCEDAVFELNIAGDIADLSWFPEQGLSAPDIPNPIVQLKNSITYLVVNKKVTTNILENGDFDNGAQGFSNDYIIDCPNSPYGPEVGTWKEGAPNDGQYCVTKATSFAFALGGWQQCSDHTGNNGNLMYVNGDITQDAKIWCQTVPVDENTNYQFSTWITSVYKGNPAKLAFSINGDLLGNPFTADLNTCNWKEFYEIWNSQTTTSAEICIVNQNTISNGNDFALDDITFQKVCVDSHSINITVNEAPIVDLGDDLSLCPGDDVVLNSGHSLATSHQWSTGETTNSVNITQPSEISLEITNKNGCRGHDTINLFAIDTPFARLPSDTTVCFFLTKSFELSSSDDAVRYDWSTGDLSKSILISKPGTYSVAVSNSASCSSADTIQIEEVCDATFIYIPNAFTPNGDGINDEFTVKGENIHDYKISIFNRWGELLFQTNNLQNNWSGTFQGNNVLSDVYVYKIEYLGVSPTSHKPAKQVRIGHINLIR